MISRRTLLHTLSVALLAAPIAEAQQPGKVVRVGFLSPTDPANPTPGLNVLRQGVRDLGWIEGRTLITDLQVKATQKAAGQLGIKIDVIGVRDPNDLEKVLTKSGRLDALVIIPDPLFVTRAERLADLTVRRRLPATMDWTEFARLGGLLATAPDYVELYRRGVSHVDKILRGTKASELPVEQTNRYEVTINLKTAKALRLTIPPSLLLRADAVVE